MKQILIPISQLLILIIFRLIVLNITKNNNAVLNLCSCLHFNVKGEDINDAIGHNKTQTTAKCEVFCLATLSLIQTMYEIFNKSSYDKIKDHVYMKHGNIDSGSDKQKWKLIHDLCNKDVYKVDLKKKKMNANSLFKSKTLVKVKHDLKSFVELSKDNDNDTAEITEEQKMEEEQKKEKRQKETENKEKALVKKLDVLKYFSLNIEYHIRTEPLYNFSEKKLVISTYHDHFVPKNIPEEFVWKPPQTINQMCDLLHDRYGKLHDTSQQRNALRYEIFKDMCKFENYIVFNVDTLNEDEFKSTTGYTSKKKIYSIKAAFILEEELFFQNKSSCSIIHCLGIEFGYEDTHHLKSLLYEAFNQKLMRDKTVVFVYKYGDNPFIMFENDYDSNDPDTFMTHEKLFAEMGFKKADIESIAHDIPRYLSTMIGDAKQITDYCKNYRKFACDHCKDSHRNAMINGAKKIKYRYDNKQKLEVYSHAFLWEAGNEHDLDRITNIKREITKKNPGTVYPFTGGGYRETNEDKPLVTFNKNFPIPIRYQQCNNGKTIHNCVWLNTACINQLIDETYGDHMIDLFERRSRSQKEYEWLNVKLPKDPKARALAIAAGEETLTDKMVCNVGYHVCKVKKSTNHKSSYLNQFLDPESTGKYIA